MANDTQEMLKQADQFAASLRNLAHKATALAWPIDDALHSLRKAAERNNLAEIEEAQSRVRHAYAEALLTTYIEAGLGGL